MRFVQLAAILMGLGTTCAIVAFPWVAVRFRIWVLFGGFCGLAATFAFVGLMVAHVQESFLKWAKQLEQRIRKLEEETPAPEPRRGGTS